MNIYNNGSEQLEANFRFQLLYDKRIIFKCIQLNLEQHIIKWIPGINTFRNFTFPNVLKKEENLLH